MSDIHEVAGHRLTLLRNGEEYFPELIAAIDAARQSICLETYIFAHDASGRRIADALRAAAQRGVVVQVLLDGFGSADLPPIWLTELSDAGVKVLWFRRDISPFTLRRNRLRRMHRKLAVIDAEIAFVGGINIINDAPTAGQAARLDYAVRVQGEVVKHIHREVLHLWRLVSWINLIPQREHPHSLKSMRLRSPQVAFFIRDNLRHRRDIERAYLRAIIGAQHEIIIANAYFLPGKRFRRALHKAVQRGVRVVLLLQGQVEYRLQHYATLALYDEMLKSGVEIYEYQASFLHAKVAVVDGEWATVGSSNIDPFSLWLAREANLVVQDSGFAGELRGSLLREMQHAARPVIELEWHARSLWGRIFLRGSYALVRLLAGMTGYTHKRDDI